MHTSYNTFDSKIHSEESAQVSESEYDEVMQMMADERDAGDGYSQWADSLEPEPVKDWLGGYRPVTEGATYNGIDI